MSCRRCQARLSEHLAGELSPRAARWMERHLAGCAACTAAREELEILSGWMGTLALLDGAAAEGEAGAQEPPDALWSRIEAELDGDEAKRSRRLPGWPVLAPAIAGTALAATVGVATGLRAAAVQREQRLDAQLAAEAERAVRDAETRYVVAEDELLGMVPERRAAALLDGEPVVMRPDGPATAGGLDAVEARFDARWRQLGALEEAALDEATEQPARGGR